MDFSYDYKKDFRPIPPGEKFERTVIAERFHLYTRQKPKHLEGLCFDRDGNLYFTSTYEGMVMFLDMDTQEMTCKWRDPYLKPASVKLNREGLLFISCLGTDRKKGCIVVADQDGRQLRTFAEGFDVDDVVFDHTGGFYFTHLAGTVNQPDGGIYYVPPTLDRIECFIPNLAGPNGVCLSTDESVMWVTEFNAGRLLRIPMSNKFITVAYHFTGFFGPDSCSVDAEDNVYVALYEQGRVMVFNRAGYPIGQVLMPNRDIGHNLCTTHPMVHPYKKELYIATADDVGEEGSWIMKAPAFATGNLNAIQLLSI